MKKQISRTILAGLLSLATALSLPAKAQNTVTTTQNANPSVNVTSGAVGILPPANGGTGVANASTQTLTRSGAHALTITTTGTTGVTLPTSGTLLGTAAAVTVPQGGTGVATLTGVPLGTGVGALSVLDYVPWTTVAHSAGNYTASGSMTWTVDAGDQTTMAYTILGKSMTVSFFLTATTVGGTPSDTLRILVPASKTIAKTMRNAVTIYNNSIGTVGLMQVTASGTTINVSNANFTVFVAGAATDIVGQITFEIN